MSRDIPNYKFLEINIQTINDEIDYPKNYKNEENDNQNKPKITFIFSLILQLISYLFPLAKVMIML
jgi:hypothetical protein